MIDSLEERLLIEELREAIRWWAIRNDLSERYASQRFDALVGDATAAAFEIIAYSVA